MAVIIGRVIGLSSSQPMAQVAQCPCFKSGELVAYVKVVSVVGDTGLQDFFCENNGDDGWGLVASSTSGDWRNDIVASTQHPYTACSINVTLGRHLIRSYGFSDLSSEELAACDAEIQAACEELEQ
jgi:hypothetical protein